MNAATVQRELSALRTEYAWRQNVGLVALDTSGFIEHGEVTVMAYDGSELAQVMSKRFPGLPLVGTVWLSPTGLRTVRELLPGQSDDEIAALLWHLAQRKHNEQQAMS